MPISKEKMKLYPKNWKEISKNIIAKAGNKCEFCGAENHKPHPITKSKVILTVAHLDHNPANCDDNNLKALCQRCHLRYDAEQHKINAQITRDKKNKTLKLFI